MKRRASSAVKKHPEGLSLQLYLPQGLTAPSSGRKQGICELGTVRRIR